MADVEQQATMVGDVLRLVIPGDGLLCESMLDVTLDRYGFPVTEYRGRPILNWIRRRIHGAKRVRVRAFYRLPTHESTDSEVDDG